MGVAEGVVLNPELGVGFFGEHGHGDAGGASLVGVEFEDGDEIEG